MKKLFVIFMICFFSTAWAGYNNESDGFRGLKWGSSVPKGNAFKKVGTDPSYGGVDKYENLMDIDKTIGAAQIKDITYGFWRDKLFSVIVTTEGFGNFQGLKEAMEKKFGEGFRANRYLEEYAWLGDITCMMLNYNQFSKKATLYMSSQVVKKEVEAYKAALAEKGAASGF